MELSLCSIDYSIDYDGHAYPTLHLFCRDKNNRRVEVLVKDFKPYFYISKHKKYLVNEFPEIENYEEGYVDYIDNNYLIKLYTQIPPQVGKLRKILEREPYHTPTFEADILFSLRYLIDKEIYTGIDYDIYLKTVKKGVDAPSRFRIMYVDIETFTKNEEDYKTFLAPIIVYGIYDSLTKKHYVFTQKDMKKEDLEKYLLTKSDLEIFFIPDEVKLLLKVRKFIRKLEPDIILTFSPFDMSYTVGRMKELGIKYRKLSPMNIVSLWNDSCKISGIQVMDISEMYRTTLRRAKWNTLEFIANKELNIEALFHNQEVSDMWEDDYEKVIIRNLRDVEMIKLLNEELHLTTYFDAIRRVAGCNLRDTLFRSRIADILDLRNARKIGYVLPTRRFYFHFDYKGGKVFQCLFGDWNNVLVVDFTTMYPSIIRVLNLGYHSEIPGEFIDNVFIVGDLKDFKINNEEISLVIQAFDKLEPLRKPFKMKAKEANSKSIEYKFNKAVSDGLKSLINCFTEDTEVLTPNGLKNINNFKTGDSVYTLNPNTNEIELAKVIQTQEFPYNGELIKIKHSDIDFLITPNHNLWGHYYPDRKFKDKWYRADEVENFYGFRLPRKRRFNSGNILEERVDLSKLTFLPYRVKNNLIKYDSRQSKWFQRFYDPVKFMKYISWFITEGHVNISRRKEYENGNIRGINYRINIFQEREDYRNEILQLVKDLGMRYSAYGKTIDVSNRILGTYLMKNFGNSSRTKHLNKWIKNLHPKYLEIFMKEMMKGDGRSNNYTYITSSEKLAKDLVLIGEKIGFSTHFSKDKEGYYTISINKNRGTHAILYPKLRHFQRIQFNGKVYCITASKNHIILAGRNSKLQWIGQSEYGKFGYSGDWNKHIPAARLYEPRVAAFITFIGRRVQDVVYDLLKKKDYNIVYGDTDSLFIQMKTKSMEEREKLIEDLNKEISNFFMNTFKATTALNLEVDKYFSRLLLLTKKRYVGKRQDGTFEWKGIEQVKRDQSLVTAEIQKELITRILNDESKESIKKYFLDFSNNFKNKSIEEIAIPLRLSKSVEIFRSSSYHLKAFVYSRDILKIPLKIGKRFYLLYIKKIPEEYPSMFSVKTKYLPSKQYKVEAIAFNKIEEIPKGFEIDYSKMKEKTIINKSIDILNIIGINIHKLKKQLNGYMSLTEFGGMNGTRN